MRDGRLDAAFQRGQIVQIAHGLGQILGAAGAGMGHRAAMDGVQPGMQRRDAVAAFLEGVMVAALDVAKDRQRMLIGAESTRNATQTLT